MDNCLSISGRAHKNAWLHLFVSNIFNPAFLGSRLTFFLIVLPTFLTRFTQPVLSQPGLVPAHVHWGSSGG